MQSNLIESNYPSTRKSVSNRRSELPFTLQDLKSAIPAYCFEPSIAKSLFYFFLDISVIGLLYGLVSFLDYWWFLPIFWVMQGTMFWALFVVGHDCGHGSFSKQKWLNNLIGHLSHIPILVPYHGWRISHRTHHQNTGNIQTDESWYPLTESSYRSMTRWEKFLRFESLGILVAYPLYLFIGSPEREAGSHFASSSRLFRPSEKWDIITSTVLWTLMIGFLGWLAFQFGWLFLLKYYVVPYLVFVVWLDLVTFLHHTEADIPWYHNEDWYFLKGALSTIDRNYGLFNGIHHNIGTHVAHHIFLNMPHYHLKTATEAIKPILGDYYRKSDDSIFKSFFTSWRSCHFVDDKGGKVFFQGKPSRK